MPNQHETTARECLAAWLRSERALGVGHYALDPSRLTLTPGAEGTTARADEFDGGVQRTDRAAPISTPAPADAARPAIELAQSLRTTAEAGDARLPPLCSEELDPQEAARRLSELDVSQVRGCRRCGLCTNRTQTVFGVGNPRPTLVFVGEGPGADEDAQGVPFVGKAGQLLTRMITAMTLTRDEVYICNVVKCRPPGNRTPEPDEMAACWPYLVRQLAILRPRAIVALGRPASQTLLATSESITKLRGEFREFPAPALARPELRKAALMPTFHPSYLLRRPDEKGKAWSDLKQVMGFLGIPVPP